MKIGQKVWVLQPNVRSRIAVYHEVWKETVIIHVNARGFRVLNGIIESVDRSGKETVLDFFTPKEKFMYSFNRPNTKAL